MLKISCYGLRRDKNNNPYLVRDNYVKYEGEQELTSPAMVYEFIKKTLHLNEYAEEELYVIGVNGKTCVSCIFKVSQGTSSMSITNAGGTFKRLLLANCSAFFMTHNHPSNRISPSQADILTTKNMEKLGKMLDIPLLDHIIVGDNLYYSFAENHDLD